MSTMPALNHTSHSAPVDANGQFQMSLAPHRIGVVSLAVRDLASVSHFYQTVIGLSVIAKDSDSERLGVTGKVLIDLQHRPGAQPQSRRDAGLFHTAFLLPSRIDLGSWLRFAAETGIRLEGASDHLVSEAVYLTDPEGNGIEIYADRPMAKWPVQAGVLKMATDPLDIDGLLRAAAGRTWAGYPQGGIIGHVHLQVGALADADGFYEKLLGFDVMVRYPGASFYGSGGYHHQLAGNIWNSRGAPPRAEGMTGLARLELLTPDTDVIGRTRTRLHEAGHASTNTADGLDTIDPWGVPVSLRLASENLG